MNLILSKVALQFAFPLGFCLTLGMISSLLVFKSKRTGVALLSLSLVMLWISSTPGFSSYLIAGLESQYPPLPAAESPEADAIVVLGGAVGTSRSPGIEVQLVNASDRVLHAARLYRSGKAPIVIATGGSSPWRGVTTPEAPAIMTLLQEWGVPDSAIVIESASLNTYQNAIHTKALLDSRGLKAVLLVTSAMHMPRALATFSSAGINAIPSPTDYQVVERDGITIFSFLPDAAALAGTSQAIKEYLGMMVYRWRGWSGKGTE